MAKENPNQMMMIHLRELRNFFLKKTKICKKQELQLEALNNQMDANKDVLDITKDMLNLKNIENDHLQSRLESMQIRVKSENDRFKLTEKKLNLSKLKEASLTKEYETQRNIFRVCTMHLFRLFHLFSSMIYCHFTGFERCIRGKNSDINQGS